MKTRYLPQQYVARNSQKGAGLVEVLVAMLLLAVGVMGYAALQIKSVGVSTESAQRAQALNLIYNLINRMQVNPTTTSAQYAAAITAASVANATPPSTTCVTGACSLTDLTTRDAFEVVRLATQLNMGLQMVPCNGLAITPVQYCVFAMWGDTKTANIAYGTAANNACMTATNAYNPKSTCLMMEVF